MQYPQGEDDSPALDKVGKKFIQEVCGVFLFLARVINGGLLPALSSLASQQAKPTEKTMKLCKKFLDFMATQEEVILTYRASKMVLAIHSDALYLSEPKARSRAGGHMFMTGKEEIPINNGAVHNISQIIRAVMSSAAEAELGALFINAKNSRFHATNHHRTWRPTTTHPDANRQCHGTRTTQQQNLTLSTKGHGHAFPLAKVPQCPRTIPVLLETWHTEPGRLLHQAPPRHTPQVCMPNNSHISKQSRIQETLPEHRRLHKIGGHK
jgi:hypothetical protein